MSCKEIISKHSLLLKVLLTGTFSNIFLLILSIRQYPMLRRVVDVDVSVSVDVDVDGVTVLV